MAGFGWIRLACLLLVLTAIVRVGDTGAEARSLAARVPDVLSLAPEEPEEPETFAPKRWTEAQISSLQDVSEDALRADVAPRPERPGSRAAAKERAPAEVPPPAEVQSPAKVSPDLSPTGPPVFYRPAGPGTPADAGPVCGDLRGAPEGGRIVFPLERRFFSSYEDTWGAPRTQGGHEGTDLMTPSGVPEYAVTDGTVVPVAGSDAGGWNTLGGHAVMVRADYSIGPVEAGDLFYYAHLERKSPLEVGSRVRAGQVVGYAGDTGQGPPGTSGLFPPHLHLGWYDGTGDREDAPSGAMNPYPLLEWIRANGGAVTGGSGARFCEAPRTGPPTPSAHGGAWPAPANPGESPDLDPGPEASGPARATEGAEKDRRRKPPAKRPSAEKAEKPPRPGGKNTRDEPPPKRQDEDRSPEPGRPDPDDQRPPRPGTGGDGHPQMQEPPEKDPPKDDPPAEAQPETEPTESQYDDPSTQEPSGPAEAPRPNDAPKPKTRQQQEEDGSGDDPGRPSQQETPPAKAKGRNQ